MLGKKAVTKAGAKQGLKVYTYKVPRKYRPDKSLPLVSETYWSIQRHFTKDIATKDPKQADYFFVPINLIQLQFQNRDPIKLMNNLKYLTTRKDHLVIALGDFSQRSHKNRYGEAYKEVYSWLDRFKLLALESTDDLIQGQDIAIIPTNTLSSTMEVGPSIQNDKQFLYSFLGELNHPYLPASHIRKKMLQLAEKDDTLIRTSLDEVTRESLRAKHESRDDFELLARNSIFTLAPAGYGSWTYRLFQAIKWGSIPVLLSDNYILPFIDQIPYDDFMIRVPEADIHEIDNILRDIDSGRIELLQRNLDRIRNKLTPEGFYKMLDETLVSQKVGR